MFKKTLVNALSQPPIWNIGQALWADYIPVFMLHRLDIDGAGSQYGEAPHKIEDLAFALEWLKKKKYHFVSIDMIAAAISQGRTLPKNSVAFTVDDGFADQLKGSVDLFTEYECPATYFVSTGFINGDMWFWDSKVQYLIENASTHNIQILCNTYTFAGASSLPLENLVLNIIFHLTQYTYAQIQALLHEMSCILDVAIPQYAPAEHAPATWSTLKAAVKKGMKIGAHTHCHPILSREEKAFARSEIIQSKNIIESRVGECSKVFCYPVGREQDFTERDEKLAEEAGFIAGVSTVANYARLSQKHERYRIPRFGLPATREHFIQYATFIEAAKSQFR